MEDSPDIYIYTTSKATDAVFLINNNSVVCIKFQATSASRILAAINVQRKLGPDSVAVTVLPDFNKNISHNSVIDSCFEIILTTHSFMRKS